MYLVLSQQVFIPGATTGWKSRVKYNGSKIYLSEDLKYFDYDGNRYDLTYVSTSKGRGLNMSPTRSALRGPVQVYYQKYFYETTNPYNGSPVSFIIVQTKDQNPYLYDKFQFDHVLFNGKRCEMIW
jgi:hypothetical protein